MSLARPLIWLLDLPLPLARRQHCRRMAGASGSQLIVRNRHADNFYNNAATYLGTTTINAGTIQFGAHSALGDGTQLTVNNGGTLNLGGFSGNHTVVTSTGSTIRNGVLNGTINAQGATFNNISGSAALNLNSGSISLTGVNSFGNIALNGGTTTVAVPTSGTPLTSEHCFCRRWNLNLDASL